MTLTIEQVRDCKFHLAPRNGYQPADVDTFVDKVEETLVTLTAENDALKRQVDQLRSDNGDTNLADVDRAGAELERVRAELARAEADAAGEGGRVDRLVVTAAPEASTAVARLLQMATEQADALVVGAEEDARAKRAEAERAADALVADAEARRRRLEEEAAERAESLEAEAQARRRDLFTTLEEEHRHLSVRVEDLRAFERDFRESLATRLQGHIDNLRSGVIEPDEKPELLDIDPAASHTPRLDALLRPDGTDN